MVDFHGRYRRPANARVGVALDVEAFWDLVRRRAAAHRMSVAVVGSLNVDLVVGVRRLPAPGETVFGGSPQRHAGGKGANQAVAAARLGQAVTMVGRVGARRRPGDYLLARCATTASTSAT